MSSNVFLDAGAGTGRFAVPLGELLDSLRQPGRVVATDLSSHMLRQCNDVWRKQDIKCGLKCVVADLAVEIPIQTESVDVVYSAATFHIITNWREAVRNLIPLLKPGGCFIVISETNQFMHQTEGIDRYDGLGPENRTLSAFMSQYHKLRHAYGEPYVGREVMYSNYSLLFEYLLALGLEKERVGPEPPNLGWNKPHSYNDIMECFRKRQMTTWGSDLTQETRSRIGASLDSWLNRSGIDMAETFFLPAFLELHVFRRGWHD